MTLEVSLYEASGPAPASALTPSSPPEPHHQGWWPNDQQMTHPTFSLTPGQTQGQGQSPLICKGGEGPPCSQLCPTSYLLVFLLGPRPLDEIWIQDPQPPVLALLVSAVLGEQVSVRTRKAAWDPG